MYVQFIQQAIRRDFNNVDEILNPPEGQDEGVWKYEHLRLHFAAVNLLCLEFLLFGLFLLQLVASKRCT